MRHPRAMFVLVLIATTVLCADTQAAMPHFQQSAADLNTDTLRLARKIAGDRQRTTRTIVTPRLVRVFRITIDAPRPVAVHVPHRAVQPFHFRLPPPVRG